MKAILMTTAAIFIAASQLVADTQENLKILTIKSKNITDKSARINVVFNQPAQAQIEYGISSKYGKFSAKESSFKYKNHTLKILDLTPQTQYQYRVHAWDQAGNKLVSDKHTLTTGKQRQPHKWASNWGYDYDKAITEAKKKNRPIFALFSGSDWCPPCIRLEKNILNTKKFQRYLKQNYVLLLLDFPRYRSISPKQRKHNRALFKKYSLGGYPTILILDETGKIIGKTGATRNSQQLITKIKQSMKKYSKKSKK